MKGRVGAVLLAAVAAFVVAGPAAADRVPSDQASCVAYFVVPQAQAGNFGAIVRTFPDIFHPLGETVSLQARSPLDACPFSPP